MHRTMLFIALLLAGCGGDSVVAPGLPLERSEIRISRGEPLDPVPAAYGDWYAAVEACIGHSGDFDAIAWRTADAIYRADGSSHLGVVVLPDTITILRDYVATEWAVKIYMIVHVEQSESFLSAPAELGHCIDAP